MNKSEKEITIERLASFIADRIEYAILTGDKERISFEAIKRLLENEMSRLR